MPHKVDYKKCKSGYSSANQEPEASDLLFNNQIKEEKNQGNISTLIFEIIDHVFNRIEQLQIIKRCEVFNEVEAAIFLRLPNPESSGRQSIRYYALNVRQLSYLKIGRDGLLFTKTDLENFLENQKVQSYRNV